jgi:serine/threonine protein kinase
MSFSIDFLVGSPQSSIELPQQILQQKPQEDLGFLQENETYEGSNGMSTISFNIDSLSQENMIFLRQEQESLYKSSIEIPQENLELSQINLKLPQENLELSQENLEQPQENLEQPKKDLSFIKENEYYTGSNGIYRVGKRLGQGGYGMVHHGTNVQTNSPVAIKTVPFKRWSESQNKFVFASFDEQKNPLEHRLLSKVQKVKGVITLLDFFQLKEGSVYVMELPDQCRTLLQYIDEKHQMTEFEALQIYHQIIQILYECHLEGVFHRDVKLENILVDGNGKVYLIDFGLALIVNKEGYSSSDFGGTWTYMPPEAYNSKKYHPETATVWSVGIVLFEMLFNILPFSMSASPIPTSLDIDQICNADVQFPSCRSVMVMDLIKKCLIKDPSQRFKLADALNHSWNSCEELKITSKKRTYFDSFAKIPQETIDLGSHGSGHYSKKQKYLQGSLSSQQESFSSQKESLTSQQESLSLSPQQEFYQPPETPVDDLQAHHALQALQDYQTLQAFQALQAYQNLQALQASAAVAPGFYQDPGGIAPGYYQAPGGIAPGFYQAPGGIAPGLYQATGAVNPAPVVANPSRIHRPWQMS